MSYELKTNTAVRIPVGPLVDPTDGKTAETSLTVTGLSVQIYQMKTDGSAVVRTQFAPTASGGDNDMALVTSSTDAMYDLELTAAQLNWLGNGRISLYDVDGFLVHYFDIHVVSANYFDNKYGSTIEDVNTKTITNGIIIGDTLAASACTKIIDDFETQSAADPTGFKVNVMEVNGTGQTAGDILAVLATIAGYLDTEIAAIVAAVITNAAGADVAADIIAIKAQTVAIEADTDVIDDGTSGLVKIAQDVAAILVDTAVIGALGAGLTAITDKTDLVTAARMGALTDLIDGGRLDLLIDAIKAVTDNLPDAGALTTIGTDTARLSAARAGVLTDWINGGRLDLLIDAIKAQTDLVTAARMGALTDWIDGGRLDLLLDAIKVITDALTAAAATKLALSAGTIGVGTVSWDNTNATTTVFYSDDITEATADHLNGRIVLFTSGALAGPPPQATDITDYALVGGEGKFTVTALTEAPADNVTFVII